MSIEYLKEEFEKDTGYELNDQESIALAAGGILSAVTAKKINNKLNYPNNNSGGNKKTTKDHSVSGEHTRHFNSSDELDDYYNQEVKKSQRKIDLMDEREIIALN